MRTRHWIVAALASSSLATWSAAQVRDVKLYGAGPADEFGTAVSLFGDTVIVGAPEAEATGGSTIGRAYVYRKPLGFPWVLLNTLEDATLTAFADFGHDVSVYATRFAVGAPGYDGGLSGKGAVYVYTDTGMSIAFEERITPTSTSSAFAGSALDLFNDALAIGAPGAFSSVTDPGTVYVYRRDAVAPYWDTLEATLTAPGGAVGDRFGLAVEINANSCAVGAPNRTVSATANAGSVYVFAHTGMTWSYEATITPPTPTSGGYFGGTLSLDNDRLLIGTSTGDLAYLYRRTGPATWTLQQTFNGLDGAVNEGFGRGVGLLNQRAVIGAVQSEYAHVFRSPGPGTWNRAERLPGNFSGLFGWSLELAGDLVAIGSPFDDDAGSNAGAVQVFWLPPFASAYGFGEIGLCPCGNDDPYAGCANSTGQGARLTVSGSASVGANDLVIQVEHMPVAKPCRLLLGDGTLSAPFGGGLRAVGFGVEGFGRGMVGTSGAAGLYSTAPMTSPLFMNWFAWITPGETWNFQCWYRDPAPLSPCGNVNFSNATAVTFVP